MTQLKGISDQEALLLLARIDERVKTMAEDIQQLRISKKCHTHTEKIRNIERIIYGMMTVIFGLLGKAVYELFKQSAR